MVQDIEDATVTFVKSKKTVKWTSKAAISILKLAEESGLKPDYGCRSGMCGSCAVKLLKGECKFIHDRTEEAPEDWSGNLLICSSVPGSKEIQVDL